MNYTQKSYEEYRDKYYEEKGKFHWGEFIGGLVIGLFIALIVGIVTHENMRDNAIDAGVAEYTFVPDEPTRVFKYKEIK